MHSFSSLYNENTVISKEYTGPLDFDITGVDCIWNLYTVEPANPRQYNPGFFSIRRNKERFTVHSNLSNPTIPLSERVSY